MFSWFSCVVCGHWSDTESKQTNGNWQLLSKVVTEIKGNQKHKKQNKKKLTLCLNQSWTSIDLFLFLFFSLFCFFCVFFFCIVSWMPKRKSNVQTALKKLIVFTVFNGFANEEDALPKVAHLAHSPDPLF
jgi:hypothetical protein